MSRRPLPRVEEHDLIAKYCQQLHDQNSGQEQHLLEVSAELDDRLNETPIERQDLIQVQSLTSKEIDQSFRIMLAV